MAGIGQQMAADKSFFIIPEKREIIFALFLFPVQKQGMNNCFQ